jgi:hypothetical protein
MKNPYPDPLAGRSGYTHELLALLTPEEIKQYIANYQWEQANASFPEKPESVYQSKAYYMYRTNQFIYDAQKVLAERGEMKSDGSEVIDHEE